MNLSNLQQLTPDEAAQAREGLSAWFGHLAYFGDDGNYRLHGDGRPSKGGCGAKGPIAPWNAALKIAFPSRIGYCGLTPEQFVVARERAEAWVVVLEGKEELVDKCPVCGGELEAECMVVVSYRIHNDGGCDQDWARENVFDDTSECRLIRCVDCEQEWDESSFLLGGQEYLVWLDSVDF
jgi:hypothetical protein